MNNFHEGLGVLGAYPFTHMAPGTLELPPRRSRRTQEMTIQRNRSSLEILTQMGFPKQRAFKNKFSFPYKLKLINPRPLNRERALAATGDKGVQLASDWLLSHVNDPTIDDKAARDYILYLCPVGQLQQEFLDFWQKSYQECGWNRAHNYFPHITLCAFFQAEDSLVSQLSHAIKKVAERITNPPETVDFDYFSSPNFIGLFVTEAFAMLLKQITTDFADEMRKANVTVEPHRKQLHVSLAYQFPTDKKEKLEALAKTINLKSPVRWDLRLYSRDKGKHNCQVRKVLYTHVPGAPDELELCDGDFVYMNESELDASTDGWYLGTSWLTGCTGMFPGIYTERTAETETWTMHRSIPIVGTDLVLKAENGPDISMDNGTISRQMLRMSRGSGQDMSSLYINDPARLLSYLQSATPFNHDPTGGFHRLAPISSLSSIPESAVLATTTSAVVVNNNRTPAVAVANKPNELTSTSPTPSASGLSVMSNILNSPDLGPSPLGTDISKPSGFEAGMRASSSSTSGLNECARSTSPKQNNRIPAIDGIVPLSAVSANSKGPRQLFVVRHGERVDFTFGKDWVMSSFNNAGQYVRYDLNMPKSIPRRKGGPGDFSKDCPLTVQGHFQARLLGEAMREKDLVISHIYSSPSLRCVETASSILESLGLELEINIEHGLFEWLGWYQLDALKFMTAAELKEAGYNVSSSYTSSWPFSKYNLQETTEQFYERSYVVTKEILKRHESEGGNVMIVAHGLNLDSCTRQLVGQPARSQVGFHEILHKIPYCAMSVVQEATVVRDTWYLIEPPILPFAHTNNPKYNWTSLTTPGLV